MLMDDLWDLSIEEDQMLTGWKDQESQQPKFEPVLIHTYTRRQDPSKKVVFVKTRSGWLRKN